MVITPKVRGFICTTAHPEGCARHVREQIDLVRSPGPIEDGPKAALVIGASTGYGLASRIASTFGAGAPTVGVFFERPAEGARTATAGWYNSAAFEKEAAEAGVYARSFNGDAFSDSMKSEVVEAIRSELGTVDTVIYSLASPRRTHPRTGEVFNSCLKPIGDSYTNKNLNTATGAVSDITIEPATEEEIAQTVSVMGGEDWEMWMDALLEGGVLAPGTRSIAYSYIGPQLTWPIYKNGTIGRAKEDLERAGDAISAKLAPMGGKAWISVNKAIVTQASSAIPVVPLYISLLYKIMKEEGTHEESAAQINRLFRERLFCGASPQPDEAGRIRVDDLEMETAVQELIAKRWTEVSTENLAELADLEGYRECFLRLFGFGFEGIDYTAESDPAVPIASINA